MPPDVQSFRPASAMVIVAHPDDAEFMAAGTVAKWTAGGTVVTYVVVTKGDKGSDDPGMTPSRLTEVREAEQRAAGAILGVRNFEFLGYPDGYLQHTLELRRDLTRVIRKYRPDVVITFDPTARFFGNTYMNHPDHRATGDAACDAIFPSARDRLTFPELLIDGYEPHRVKQVWLGMGEPPDAVVDITVTIDKKRQALLAHPSQMDSSTADFAGEMARQVAKDQPFEFAESFRRIFMDQQPESAETAVSG